VEKLLRQMTLDEKIGATGAVHDTGDEPAAARAIEPSGRPGGGES